MPLYPMLNSESTSVINTQVFYGLNRGLSIADGEMADMENMTGDNFPVLATRKGRSIKTWPGVDGGGKSTFDGEVTGMLGTDRLVVCQGGKVYVDGAEHALTLSDEEHMQPKQLVSMGAYVCIWPDKKYLSLVNPDDYGDMGAKWTAAEGATISAVMCRKDGTDYDAESITVSGTAPENPVDQQLWLDTSGENHVLKQYSAIYLDWIQVATTFIKIQADGIGKNIREEDVVFLSGVRRTGEAQTQAGQTVQETVSFPGEDFSLYSRFQTTHYGGTDYRSTTAETVSRTMTITVEGIPEGARVMESNLRVTTSGSHYGAKVLTLNGVRLKEGQENLVPAEVTGNGEMSFKFVFQSYNNATVSGNHGGTINFTGIALEVSYETGASGGQDADDKALEALNTSNIIYGRGDNYIIVAGLLHGAVTLDKTLVAERRIPDLDYVCEANNRLWGCAYDRADGQLTNEIRACALGDFRNWYTFRGVSTDSYVMSVGSEGKFTGAYSFMGVPIMFKEGFLHKISGTIPANFTINTQKCRGVQDGSWRSTAVVNETLLYKAREDVMAYDGATPYAISEKIGREKYTEASAGAYRDKYYICMRDESAAWHLYVYDTSSGLWHLEDGTEARCMANVGGELILAARTDSGAELLSVDSGEEDVPWSATFGTFGFEYEEQKYLSRFNIRAQMSKGSIMKMEIMYDSDGIWHTAGETRCPALRTVLLPIIPRRCDHCRVRISGRGSVRIYSIARVLRKGRDG